MLKLNHAIPSIASGSIEVFQEKEIDRPNQLNAEEQNVLISPERSLMFWLSCQIFHVDQEEKDPFEEEFIQSDDSSEIDAIEEDVGSWDEILKLYEIVYQPVFIANINPTSETSLSSLKIWD